MALVRPELDGSRLYVPHRPEVWLVFHGLRRHVVSPQVHDALFKGAEGHTATESVSEVMRGPDLNEGTCLVRGDGVDGVVHLVTGFPATEVRRHRIVSWKTFEGFGFAERLIRTVPALVLGAIPPGRDLCGPALATPGALIA